MSMTCTCLLVRKRHVFHGELTCCMKEELSNQYADILDWCCLKHCSVVTINVRLQLLSLAGDALSRMEVVSWLKIFDQILLEPANSL